MAITNADGSIILTTKVDTSGISKGSIFIKSALQSVDTTVKKVQNSFSAFRDQKVNLQVLNQAIKDQQYVLNSLNLEYAEYVARGKASSAEAKALKTNIDAATAEMKEMQAAATTLGAKGSASINKIGVAMKTLLSYFIGIQTVFKVINFSGEAAEFASQTEAGIKRLVDIYGEASQVVGDFIDQNARAIGMSRASAASFAATYGNIFSVFAEQSTNAQLTNEFLNLTAVIASKTGRTVEEVQEKIKSGLFGNLRAIDDLGIFVRQSALIMTDAFKKIADGRSWEQLNNYEQQQVIALAILEQGVNKYGNEVMQTTALTRAQYKAAYQDFQATWGQVVNKVLIPVLKVLTQVFTIATKGLQIIAGLTGKTIDTSVAFSSQEEAIGGAVDNQNELTDAVKGTNKELKKSLAGFDELNTLSQDEGSGASSGGASAGGALGLTPLDTDKGVKAKEEVDAMILSIMGVVGFGLVAIGLLLCATGHIAWGIGFIIFGAGLLGVTMATIKSDAISQEVKDALTNVIIIAGIVAVIIGILCCFAQKWVIGIGLIVLGVSSMGVAIGLNWNGIKQQIETKFGGVLYIIGAVAIVLGILCCFAQMWALGIGLIVTGALAVGTTVAVHWDAIKTATINAFNAVMNWVKTWGLLVLGIILLISGVSAPLGIALIYKGAKNLTEAKDPKWMWLLDKVKTVWQAVQGYWNSNIAKYFTATWWGNLAKGAINGFLKWIVNGLNKLIDKLNSFGFNLPDVLGGGRVGFNISKLTVPQLAKGAVLPPNKPFLSIVGDQKNGTNIEAPLDTIKQGVAEVLANMNVGSGFNGRIEIPLFLDGRQIALAVREAENNLGSQTVFGGFANAY